MSSRPAKMNPFPGLRPFTQEEDYLFFGREEQTLELLQRLGSNRFVAVVGTSGSGKSSLVRCGLLSELLGGRMLGAGSAWEIAVTHPGGNPLALLTDSLLEADLYDREEEHARENLLATLSRSHFGLVEAVKQADLGEGTNFLLVVDQFEEIFRFQDAGQRQQEVANEFVSLLLEAVAQKEVPIYVVLTMRSDFIGECGQFEGLAEMVNRGEFLIPRLTREQYKRVIEGPIKVAGGQIAPRLLQRLLNDLGQQADQLPCLQHAMMRTWDVWAQGRKDEVGRVKDETEASSFILHPPSLDLDDYQRVGKMSQALSLHADEIYESLASDRQRELCQGIFQALTVEESNSRGIRRPQRLGRLCQILEVPADELLPIIDAYRKSGVTFLMPSPEVALTDQTIIDISHESLMRVWMQLRQWVEEETQAAGIYHRLSESATLHEQGKAGLYRDPELGIALAWRESKRPNAAWAERYRPGFATAMGFLEASQQASVAEEQARETARQHELEQAQQLAEAQQLRLEQQQRSARKLRKMMTGLAAVAVVAGAACIAAMVANNQANRLRIVASQEAENARFNAKKAEQSALEANRLSEAAQLAERAMERTAHQAEADRIAAQRENYRSTVRLAESMLQGNDDARFRVADILWQTQPELRAWEWGYLMAQCPLEEWSLQTDATGLNSAVATIDGRFLVTAGIGGTVVLWNLESRQQVWQVESGRVLKLAADPLNRFVAIGSEEDTLPQYRLLDLKTGKLVHESGTKGPADITISGTGEEFYVLDNVGNLRCFDTLSGKQLAQTVVTGLPGSTELKARDWGSVLSHNVLFVDTAGDYVGIFNRFGAPKRSDPKFRFFQVRTLRPTTQLAVYNELANNVGSPSTPILNAALGELTYSFTSSVYRKTIDGERSLLCDLSDYVQYLTVDPVSGSVLAATANGTVEIVDGDGGKRSILHGAPITGLATLTRGRFVTAGADGLVKCWTLTPSGTLAAKTAAPVFGSASANFVDFTSDGKNLLYRTWDRHSALYQLDSLSYRHFLYPDRSGNVNVFPIIRPHTNELVDYSHNGLLIFPRNSRGTDRELARLIPVSRPVSAAFDDEGRILVVSSSDGNPAVFDLESNEPVPAPDVKGSGPVTINSSGTRAALQTKERVLVWEVATGRLLNSLDVPRFRDSATPPLVFHPDGELIAVHANLQNPESTDGWDRLVLWNSSLGETQTTIQSQPGVGFLSCKFSADGHRLYAVCSDKKVRILDWKLGKELIALTGGANLDRIAVSPDGLTVAYAGYNPNLFFAKSLPWAGETPRHETFYRAVDDLRRFTAETSQVDPRSAVVRGADAVTFSNRSNKPIRIESITLADDVTPQKVTFPILNPGEKLDRSNTPFGTTFRFIDPESSEQIELFTLVYGATNVDEGPIGISISLPASNLAGKAGINETLADIACRQGRPADANINYAAAIRTHQSIVLEDPSKAVPQDRLATAYLKQLAAAEQSEEPARLKLLQQATSFWQRLEKKKNVHPAGSGHLVRFQLQLINQQLTEGKGEARKTLPEVLSFWAGQLVSKPADRQVRYCLRQVCQKLTAVYPNGADDAALQEISSALDRAGTPASRNAVIEQIMPFEDILTRLVALHPEEPQWQLALARHLEERGNAPLADEARKKALTLFKDWLANDPQNTVLAEELADLLAAEQEWESAIAIYSMVITAETTDVALLSKRAAGCLAAGQWELAKSDWLRAVQQQPELAEDVFNRFRQAARWSEATEFGLIMAAQATDALTANNLAWPMVIQPDANGQYPLIDVAVRLAQKACELQPGNPAYPNTLGVAYYRKGQWQPALEAIEKSNQGIDHPANWLFMAMAHSQLGNQAEARKWFDKSAEWRRTNPLDAELQLFFSEAVRLLETATSNAVLANDWATAAASDSTLTELSAMTDSITWMHPATLWAYAGDADRHREVCQEMLARYQASTVPNDLERVLKVMLLLENGPDLPLDSAERFVASIESMTGDNRVWFLGTRALLECRKGNYAEAHQLINEAFTQAEENPNVSIKALHLAVRSLTFAKQKDVAGAQTSLDELRQLMSEELKMSWDADGRLDGSTILNGVAIDHDKLIPEIIRREAETLIQSADGATNPKPLAQ